MISDDHCKNFIKENLKLILERFLNLINEFGNETLIGALTKLFKKFAEEINPLALEIMNNLCNLILKNYLSWKTLREQ